MLCLLHVSQFIRWISHSVLMLAHARRRFNPQYFRLTPNQHQDITQNANFYVKITKLLLSPDVL